MQTQAKVKHTPGPWNSELINNGTDYQISSKRRYIATLAKYGNLDSKCDDLDKANARLIAAAPELLEALKDVLRWWDSCPLGKEYDGINTKQIKQAIAKAEGKES